MSLPTHMRICFVFIMGCGCTHAREAAALGDEARAEVHVVGVDEGDGVALLVHNLVHWIVGVSHGGGGDERGGRSGCLSSFFGCPPHPIPPRPITMTTDACLEGDGGGGEGRGPGPHVRLGLGEVKVLLSLSSSLRR